MALSFQVDKDILEKAVSRIITVCERPSGEGKNTLPHFFFIRVDGYGTALKLSAGNSIRNIEVLVPGVTEHDPFCFGVYGDYFHRILKALPSCALQFSIRDACYMHNGSSTLKFQILEADRFPSAQDREQHDWWEVDYRYLFSKFDKVSYCVDKQGTIDRSYVKCVHISPESFICTDHQRLSLVPNDVLPYAGRCLVSVESLSAFSSLFDIKDPKGFVYIGESEMCFSQGYIYARTRLSSYDAPSFSKALPTSPFDLCQIPRTAFLMSVKRAIIVADRDKAKVIPLTLLLTGGNMKISLDVQGFAIVEDLPVVYSGPHMRIDVNVYHLYQALKHITGDTVCMEIRESDKPVILTDIAGEHRNSLVAIRRGG